MAVFRVEFSYVRTATCFIEADSEDELQDFIEEDPEWDPLQDLPELIELDESVPNPDGDYVIVGPVAVTANYRVEDGDLVEADDE